MLTGTPCELSRNGSVCRGSPLRVLSPTCTHVAPRCTAQALDDHSVRHTRILEALEAEKQKIAQEVQALQQNRGGKDRAPPGECATGSALLGPLCPEMCTQHGPEESYSDATLTRAKALSE